MMRLPVATCCDTLGIENGTSAHVRAQYCSTDLAKRLQRHATSTNFAWKILPFSNLSQQHPTPRYRVAKCMQHVDIYVALKCYHSLAWAWRLCKYVWGLYKFVGRLMQKVLCAQKLSQINWWGKDVARVWEADWNFLIQKKGRLPELMYKPCIFASVAPKTWLIDWLIKSLLIKLNTCRHTCKFTMHHYEH